MHCDPIDSHLLLDPILLIHLQSLQLCQRLQALVSNQLPEHRVQPVQMRGLVEQNEELGSVGVGPLVGHADDAPLVVSQHGPDLVFEGRAVNGPAALGVVGRGGVGGCPGLHHEGRDHAVEGGSVVVAGGTEG